MLNVIVSDCDERLARSLMVLLGQIFVTAYAGQEMIACPGSPPELLLCHRVSRCRVTGPKTIAVLGERFCPELALPDGAIILAESANFAAVSLAEQRGLRLFPCGLAADDALTLSHIGENSAALSLTRTEPTLGGASAEPFELPLKLTRMPLPFTLLAACGVAVLAGKAEALPFIVM